MSKLNNFVNASPAAGGNEKQAIKSAINSIVASLGVMDSEKEHINDILKQLKDNHEIKPKVARKVASILHKGNLEEIKANAALVEELLGRIS